MSILSNKKPGRLDSGSQFLHGLQRKLLAVSIGALSAAPAWAQSGSTPAADVETVVVLGTSRTDLSALESNSPIDVVSVTELTGIGAVGLSEALVRLNPSANFPQDTTGPQAASNGKSIALHGLSPDQTLVLVNGKRLVAQATLTNGNPPMFGYMGHPTDINVIPVAAIDHIEVLRDGASALYGADAVGGVVNIVLKNQNSGGGFTTQIGQYTAEDKPHGAPDELTQYYRAWQGFSLPGDGFITFAGEIERIYHPEEGVPSPNPVYAPSGPAAQGNLPNYDPLRHLMGYAGPTRDWKLLVNAEYGFNEQIRPYANASYAHFLKVGSSLTRPMYDVNSVIGLFPEGRDDFTDYTNNVITAAGGIKYQHETLGEFDVSVNYGRNSSNSYGTLAYNQSLGLESPIGLDNGTNVTSLINAGVNWVNEYDLGQHEPVVVTAGVALRKDIYEAKEGEWASWYLAPGAVIGPGHFRWNAATQTFTPLNPNTPVLRGGGISPEDAGTWNRNVKAVYASLEGRYTEKFGYGIAARFEDYSDFGSVISGKLSARYDFTPAFALRGTVSNGFRAPSLIQNNLQSKGASVAQGTLLIPSLSLPTSDPLAQLLGAENLRPEKSHSFIGGVVWRPWDNAVTVTADVYQINVKDKIAYSEALQDRGNGLFNAILVANGYQSGTIARFFVNGVDTRTRGLDVSIRGGFDTGFGDLDLSALYSIPRTKITDVIETPAALAASGQEFVGVVNQLQISEATPTHKLILGQALTAGDWSFTLSEKLYGRYKQALISLNPTPQTHHSQWVVDLGVAYNITDSIKLGVGAKNLFNSFPDPEIPSNRRVGQTNYPNLAPEGFDGRFLYANVVWEW